MVFGATGSRLQVFPFGLFGPISSGATLAFLGRPLRHIWAARLTARWQDFRWLRWRVATLVRSIFQVYDESTADSFGVASGPVMPPLELSCETFNHVDG